MSKETQTSETKLPKMIMFELVDKQNSTFLKEGTVDDYLNAPAKRLVLNTGIEVVKDNKNNTVHRRLRYIKNCPFLEMDEQIKQGWTPSITGADTIEFEFGFIQLTDQGDDFVKAQFLRRVVFNEANSSKKPGVDPIWREVKEDEAAEQNIVDYLMNTKIYDFVSQFAKEKAGEVVYEEKVIDRYLSMIPEAPASFNSVAEKALYLLKYAQSKGQEFLDMIATRHGGVTAIVGKAIREKVIALYDKKFSYTPEHGGALILSVRSNKEQDQINELVEALMHTEEGMDNLSNIKAILKEEDED